MAGLGKMRSVRSKRQWLETCGKKVNGSLDFWLELPFMKMEKPAGQADLEEQSGLCGYQTIQKTYRINNSMR